MDLGYGFDRGRRSRGGVDRGVVGEQVDLRLEVVGKIIYENEKENWTEQAALRVAGVEGERKRRLTINDSKLGSVG